LTDKRAHDLRTSLAKMGAGKRKAATGVPPQRPYSPGGRNTSSIESLGFLGVPSENYWKAKDEYRGPSPENKFVHGKLLCANAERRLLPETIGSARLPIGSSSGRQAAIDSFQRPPSRRRRAALRISVRMVDMDPFTMRRFELGRRHRRAPQSHTHGLCKLSQSKGFSQNVLGLYVVPDEKGARKASHV
jgi:hypothetical protein